MRFTGLVDSEHPCSHLVSKADGILTKIFTVEVQNESTGLRCNYSPTIFEALDCLNEALKLCPNDAALLLAKAVVLFFCDPGDEAQKYFHAAMSLDPNLLDARMCLQHWTAWKNFLHFARWDEASELHESMAFLRDHSGFLVQIMRDGLQNTSAILRQLPGTEQVTAAEVRFVLSLTPYGPLFVHYLLLRRPQDVPLIMEGTIVIKRPSELPSPYEGSLLVRQLAQQNYCYVILTDEQRILFNQRIRFSQRLFCEIQQIADIVATRGQYLDPSDYKAALEIGRAHV